MFIVEEEMVMREMRGKGNCGSRGGVVDGVQAKEEHGEEARSRRRW